MKISAINEESLLIRFSDEISEETHNLVKYYNEKLKHMANVLSVVPSYNSLMVYFDINNIDFNSLTTLIESIEVPSILEHQEKTIIKIPVCYDMGLDLKRVSEHTGLSEMDIIKKHTAIDYLIYMIGFTPGFPYLGGMDHVLETPRLEVPRTKIEAGSVGIGGKQTGVYPLNTPGGWNIIGKTPVTLFNSETSETLLKMGQYIRFYNISVEEYEIIKNDSSYKVEVISC